MINWMEKRINAMMDLIKNVSREESFKKQYEHDRESNKEYDETDMEDGFANKDKFNEKLTSDAIEDVSKVGKSRTLKDCGIKTESNSDYKILEETDLTGEYVNKDEFNDEINIEYIEGLNKEEQCRDLDDQKVKREKSDECSYDILDETDITEGCTIKDECNVGHNIEDQSKEEKSREVGDNAIQRESKLERQYDILDKTDIIGEYVNKDECNDGTNIEDIKDVSNEDQSGCC